MATVESEPAPGRSDRERILRTLTFWLRPEFVLRVSSRFQKIVGFDRAMGLASSALTALIPLAIIVSAFASQLGGKSTADRIIDRYELTGGGADAIRDIFSPSEGASTSLSFIGFIFLVLAILSFTRAMQRLFESTWEIKPLSVRNSLNGLLWIGGLVLYLAIGGTLHALVGKNRVDLIPTLLTAPLTLVFLVWSGWVLSAKRIARRRLVPFAVIGAAVVAIYSVGAAVYVPHLFSSYVTRYGVIGAVVAMISALFCVMVVLVGSAALGREVDDELGRIRRGERPADDEVQRQWREITTEARTRWQTLRERRQRSG